MPDVETIQSICVSFKAVTEDIKWDNNLVFSVGGKMFCMIGLESPNHCSFKVKDEEFEELSTQDGFMPAPYMARAKWVTVAGAARISKKDWEIFLRQSYELLKRKLTKKAKAELGI